MPGSEKIGESKRNEGFLPSILRYDSVLRNSLLSQSKVGILPSPFLPSVDCSLYHQRPVMGGATTTHWLMPLLEAAAVIPGTNWHDGVFLERQIGAVMGGAVDKLMEPIEGEWGSRQPLPVPRPDESGREGAQSCQKMRDLLERRKCRGRIIRKHGGVLPHDIWKSGRRAGETDRWQQSK